MTEQRVELPEAARPRRRTELDAIRLLVVLGLVFFPLRAGLRRPRRLLRQESRDHRGDHDPGGLRRGVGDADALLDLGPRRLALAPSARTRRVHRGAPAPAGRAIGVRHAGADAAAAVATAALRRSRLRRVVLAILAAVLRRPPGPERVPLRHPGGALRDRPPLVRRTAAHVLAAPGGSGSLRDPRTRAAGGLVRFGPATTWRGAAAGGPHPRWGGVRR